MILYVDANGNQIGATQSDDLDAITSLNGAAYAVHVDDATYNSVMASATNATLQVQGLTPGQPNKFGLATATGTLATVAIPSATVANDQRNAISQKYDPQIDQARQNYLNAVADGKPSTTITKYQNTVKTLQTNKTNEMMAVTG